MSGRVEPFFLPSAAGERFCLYHVPQDVARDAVLYVHPFAEEMNKARRMAALQARRFAAQGLGVLLIDLHGCGDSAGDFGEARWEIWKEDLRLAWEWLEGRHDGTIHLWGLRLGALLAADFAAGQGKTPGSLILWQPVVNGEVFLTQFLRLRVAAEMLAGEEEKAGVRNLREALRRGEPLEIAGYELAPALAEKIESLSLAQLPPCGVPVHWFEIVAEAGRSVSPAAQRAADAWCARGAQVQLRSVAGLPFWNTIEIAECADLLAQTSAVFPESVQ